MPEQQDQRPTSIDHAVRTVIAEATTAAVGQSIAEVKDKLESATKQAREAAEALVSVTDDAHKAVESGGGAIRRLYQLVWAVALMPVLSAIAGPIVALWQGSRVDAPTIAGVVGALAPLAGLVVLRWVTRQTGATVHGVHGEDDARSPRP